MPGWRSDESSILRLAVGLAVLVLVSVFVLPFDSNFSRGLSWAAYGLAWALIGVSFAWLFGGDNTIHRLFRSSGSRSSEP